MEPDSPHAPTTTDHPEDKLLHHVSKVTERMLRLVERAQSVHAAAGQEIADAISRILPYLELGSTPPLKGKLFIDRRPEIRGGRWKAHVVSGAKLGESLVALDGPPELFLDNNGRLWEAIRIRHTSPWRRALGEPAVFQPWTDSSADYPAGVVLDSLLQTERFLATRLEQIEAHTEYLAQIAGDAPRR